MPRIKKKIGKCEICGTSGKLVKYRGLYTCEKCLNPESTVSYGDPNHPLVTSPPAIFER